MTRLNTDIASGNAPDIMILSAAMPIKSYVSKGVFEDLTPYLEKDEEISQKEYLDNIQEAFRTDGMTYAIVPSFYVTTVAGKTADVGDAPLVRAASSRPHQDVRRGHQGGYTRPGA